MKLRRNRYNRLMLLLSFCSMIFAFLFILFSLFTWYFTYNGNEMNSLEMIQWSGIPIYVPNIPRYIIQTSKYSMNTNNSFIRLNPTYKYIHYNDSAAEEFVRKTMPDYIYQSYISLPKLIMKADYFRYIVLLVNGGIYTDIDTICLRPIDTWINGTTMDHIGLIIGIEADVGLWDIFQEHYARQIQFVQWTIAAAPAHPILYQIVKHIADITPMMAHKAHTEKQVLEWTGPAIWTDIVSNYFSAKYGFSLGNLKNLKESKRVGEDIYILPITAFSPGLGRMGSNSINHPEARVQHTFSGTWKNINRNKSIRRVRFSH